MPHSDLRVNKYLKLLDAATPVNLALFGGSVEVLDEVRERVTRLQFEKAADKLITCVPFRMPPGLNYWGDVYTELKAEK
jgi:hypothetical protein